MNVQEIGRRLESIIDKPVELIGVPNSVWKKMHGAFDPQDGEFNEADTKLKISETMRRGAVQAGCTWFFISCEAAESTERIAFQVKSDQLELPLRELIALLVQTSASDPSGLQASEEETEVQQLGRWLADTMEQGESPHELPDTLRLKSRLFTELIPFLLICEGAQNSLGGYEELHQLLSTFLEREVLVVPLREREWLLLVDRLDVLDLSESLSEGEESEQELLEAFGLGLYELIASEWAGIFNLSVSEPLQPAHGLIRALRVLRESVFLGKTFHVTRHVHLPWELDLERLVYSIPGEQRDRFMERIEGRAAVLADSEMLTTLETFFQMNCNVSETAKRLYIHRNTLIYRLDKVKQEIGFDVRNFDDAVSMRLALLLDKVTKD